MRRSSGKNAVCVENLEKALAECPETYGHLDLITFGFPCQDLSIAGDRKGLQGKKSSLFFECMRIVQLLVPKWLLIENVPGLLSSNEGRDMAVVLQTLSESGYGWTYRILDSQYWGLAQRRKRVFIVGSLGRIPPLEILFEPKSSGGNDTPKQKVGGRGLCISTRDGGRQDPTSEAIIASTLGTSANPAPNYGAYFVAKVLQAEAHGRNSTSQYIAQTIGATPRGNTFFIWQDTHIAETDPDRKRTVAGVPSTLDSVRGIVLGNAVSVPVAKWIAERIIKYGMETKSKNTR